MEDELRGIGARLQLGLRISAISLPVVVREDEGAVEGADDGAAVDPEEGVQVRIPGNVATERRQITVRRTAECCTKNKRKFRVKGRVYRLKSTFSKKWANPGLF